MKRSTAFFVMLIAFALIAAAPAFAQSGWQDFSSHVNFNNWQVYNSCPVSGSPYGEIVNIPSGWYEYAYHLDFQPNSSKLTSFYHAQGRGTGQFSHNYYEFDENDRSRQVVTSISAGNFSYSGTSRTKLTTKGQKGENMYFSSDYIYTYVNNQLQTQYFNYRIECGAAADQQYNDDRQGKERRTVHGDN